MQKTMKYLLILISFVMFCAQPAHAAKKTKNKHEKVLLAKAKKWDIDISQEFDRNRHNTIKGKAVTGDKLTKELERFFDCLEYLPENFVRRSGINKVVILEDLTHNDVRAGGIATGNLMILKYGFNKHTFFHELFHIFDDTANTNTQWCRLNPKGFIYKGSEFRDADLTKRQAKKVEKDSWLNKMMPHFVGEYAMSFEQEDRAEVFAAMIVEGRDFKRRTTRSTVMKKKMEFIIDMTDSKSLLGRDFWKKRLKGIPLE